MTAQIPGPHHGSLITRRSIFTGAAASLICAPAIVRASVIVATKAITLSPIDQTLCVPKILSALISRKNRLTSAHHDRAAVFSNGRLGRAIQVEEPA
jgi:hypothetical protein